jgi:hypothetical protein
MNLAGYRPRKRDAAGVSQTEAPPASAGKREQGEMGRSADA